MVDDVRENPETAENKASAEEIERLDRARLCRERREAEQRKRLDELRAHAAAAQAQREKRDEDRRRRQAEQRARDDERRQQVEERKRAIWEASVSRRESLLQRERDRTERLERARAARTSPRSAFAFGSSTPRLLEPLDPPGFIWTARSTNPIDQMNFFEQLAASTTNVMFSSAPLTRPASALQLNADADNKDESDKSPQIRWSTVARRRTDLVPTLPAPRAPGRAHSMTRLDKLPSPRPLHTTSPSMHHLNRPQTRSGETTPGSRPGSAMSTTAGGVLRRTPSGSRKTRPISIAGTGIDSPKGDGDTLSGATTPSVSRDGTLMVGSGGDTPQHSQTSRRPRPLSVHASSKPGTTLNPMDSKPPVYRKPKTPKDDKTQRGGAAGRSPSPTPRRSPSPARRRSESPAPRGAPSPSAATSKVIGVDNGIMEGESNVEPSPEDKVVEVKPDSSPKLVVKEDPQEKSEESDMTASMTAKRITTEEEAKAALAERRRRAREEIEKQAELDKQRLQIQLHKEAEMQRLEEERQRHDEEEARELAALQRQMEEEKLRKAIEAQKQLEREEMERRAHEEAERQLRLKEDEKKRKAAEEAEKLRKEEAEREEKERIARKQRVEAIMARTRLKRAEEDKKQEENKGQPEQELAQAATRASKAPAIQNMASTDNGNAVPKKHLSDTTLPAEVKVTPVLAPQSNLMPTTVEGWFSTPNNGNITADQIGLSEKNDTEDKPQDHVTATNNMQQMDNSSNANVPTPETNNGNVQHVLEPNATVGHISANFIQSEIMSAEHSQTKLPENVPKLIEDDFTAHNGHGATHNHPLTLQNAI